MPRRGEAAAGVALAAALLLAPGCSRPVAREAEVGHHRVRFVLPGNWEHLDHGRQQLFRRAERQFSLVDLGPASREALVREIRAAGALWQAGRRKDAIQRVRELRAPALRYAPRQQLSDFWRPWTDAVYAGDWADSLAIEAAFDSLVEGTAMFARPTPEVLVRYVLELTGARPDREVASREQRTIHGASWTTVETWDRVSHLNRSRAAFAENDGHLLVLAMDRGRYEELGPGFDALLASLEVTPRAPRAR